MLFATIKYYRWVVIPIDARDVPCGRYGVHDPRGGRLLPPLN